MVPGASAGDEQDAALTLQILGVGQGVAVVGRDRGGVGNHAFLDTDHGDGPELQAFEGVHGAGPHARGTVPAADRGGVQAIRGERGWGPGPPRRAPRGPAAPGRPPGPRSRWRPARSRPPTTSGPFSTARRTPGCGWGAR